MQGLDWLAETICRGNLDCSWPIGFYFAKLWYYERLYPAIFSLGALGAALNQIESEVPKETPTLPAG
jgi:squalene-hopene/tetraprenyl-beta-curcumene cyclase